MTPQGRHTVEERAFEVLCELLGGRPPPLVLGVAGAQGSGKSTLANALAARINSNGGRAAAISLDDFYLGRLARRRLAAEAHPLFITRGPPGTHDVAAAVDLIDSVKGGRAVAAPVFDKSLDDRVEDGRRNLTPAPLDILIFEGWCLGARAEDEATLAPPINMLERVFDADGRWRRAVNEALAGAYRQLFEKLDALIFLRAPDFGVVARWRAEQERSLGTALGAEARHRLMREDEIAFFVQHYERITRRMMADMPGRADMTLQLGDDRSLVGEAPRRPNGASA